MYFSSWIKKVKLVSYRFRVKRLKSSFDLTVMTDISLCVLNLHNMNFTFLIKLLKKVTFP